MSHVKSLVSTFRYRHSSNCAVVNSGRCGTSRILRKSELRVHMANCINPNTSTLEPDRPQHDRFAACVIAQQYSSATLVSLRFHSRKEQVDARFKNIVILFVVTFFRNCVSRGVSAFFKTRVFW